MKLAILNTGSTNNRKGAFNNVHERIKHIQEVTGVQVDVFLIRHYDSWVFKLLRNKKELIEKVTIIDNVVYNNLWVKHRMWDYILANRLKKTDISCKSQLAQFVSLFKSYDLLSAHALPDMYIAYLVKQKFGIPFVNTWHGSDINIWPFVNKKGFKTTKLLLENADYNFFVSKRLQDVSDEITKTNNKIHLYTGPSENFHIKTKQEKEKIRRKLSIQSKFIVGYIGNMVPIKNVLVLPQIFSEIQSKINDISFVIVGDGELLGTLKKKLHEYKINNCTITGKLEPEEIPEIMGSFDILLLPSLNEGMPRVTLEAQASGVHVIGSDVGGIKESLGEENSFVLDKHFITNTSNRAIQILKSGEKPRPLLDEFSWNNSIEKEMNIYSQILNSNKLLR